MNRSRKFSPAVIVGLVAALLGVTASPASAASGYFFCGGAGNTYYAGVSEHYASTFPGNVGTCGTYHVRAQYKNGTAKYWSPWVWSSEGKSLYIATGIIKSEHHTAFSGPITLYP